MFRFGPGRMSYHIVSIDSPNCSLSCRDGQLTCKTAEGEKRLPLEDVASIIITSFSASIHSQLFVDAAKHGVALIICEAFKPVSLVLPANSVVSAKLQAMILLLRREEENESEKTPPPSPKPMEALSVGGSALPTKLKPTPPLAVLNATVLATIVSFLPSLSMPPPRPDPPSAPAVYSGSGTPTVTASVFASRVGRFGFSLFQKFLNVVIACGIVLDGPPRTSFNIAGA